MIAIDGKTLRSSYQRGNRQSTIHMVNAFACKNKVVLGQIKTSEKSNEITAIPELIKLLDIEGALVSIDAMGCQVNIAEHIVDRSGDYLFTLKSNEGNLHKAVETAFSEARKKPLGGLSIEQNHGHIEALVYHVLSTEQLKAEFSQWPQLQTLGMSISFRQQKEKEPELMFLVI